jgi:RimJ/RimL family protein N-acetyltransferase
MPGPALTAPTRLEGDRIFLRQLAEADTDHILRWRADPVVAREMFSERPPTRAGHEAWLENLRTEGRRLEFVIVAREGDRPVGTVGLSEVTGSGAEFGILIGDPAARGTGFASEAGEVLLDFAFDVLKLERIVLHLFADNAPALRLYERLGFTEDVSAAGERTKDGVKRPTARMCLNRVAWLRRSCRHGVAR